MAQKFNSRKLKCPSKQMLPQKSGKHIVVEYRQGKWSKKEQEHYINVLELMAVKFEILAFTKKYLKFNYSCLE